MRSNPSDDQQEHLSDVSSSPLSKKTTMELNQQKSPYHPRTSTHHWMTIPERRTSEIHEEDNIVVEPDSTDHDTSGSANHDPGHPIHSNAINKESPNERIARQSLQRREHRQRESHFAINGDDLLGDRGDDTETSEDYDGFAGVLSEFVQPPQQRDRRGQRPSHSAVNGGDLALELEEEALQEYDGFAGGVLSEDSVGDLDDILKGGGQSGSGLIFQSSTSFADSSTVPLSPSSNQSPVTEERRITTKHSTDERRRQRRSGAFAMDSSGHDQFAKVSNHEENSNNRFSIQSPIDRRLRQSMERRQRKSGAFGMNSADLDQFLKGNFGNDDEVESAQIQSPIDRRIRQSMERRQRKSSVKGQVTSKDSSMEPNCSNADDSFEYLESPGAFGVHSVGVGQQSKGRLTRHPDSQPPLPPPFLSDSPLSAGSARRVSSDRLTSASYHGSNQNREGLASTSDRLTCASYHGSSYNREGLASPERFASTSYHGSSNGREGLASSERLTISSYHGSSYNREGLVSSERLTSSSYHGSGYDRESLASSERLASASYHGCTYNPPVNSSRIVGSIPLHLSLHSRGDIPIITEALAVVDPPIQRSQHDRQPSSYPSNVPAVMDEIVVGDTPDQSLDDSAKADETCCHRRNRLLWIVVIALVVISAIGFGVGLGLRNSSTSAIPPPSSSDAPSNPTIDPSNSNKDAERLESFRDWIVAKGISNAESLNDPDSAPYRALDWLTSQDPLQLPIPVGDTENDHHEIVERYVASVLFFATNERFDFRVPEESACSWHTNDNKGIYCRGADDNTSNAYVGVTHISLPRAFLEGYFPLELCSLPHLVHIDFSKNSLANLPDEIGKCSQLEGLLLGDNLWGTESSGIPGSLFELTKLKELQLFCSHIFLDLAFNDIEGTLPPHIGELTKLVQLDLSSNYLSGVVPNELVSLSNLVALDLSGNFDLSGSLDGLCNSTMMILQNDAEATIETPSFFASEPLVCSCCSTLEN
ncbi:MAG: hypothetical protein SGBAC_002428 [Bacillariaceae sp.]